MPRYFDNHATTPLDPLVLEAMLPFFTEHFGNAESNQHAYGWKAKAAIENARAQVAATIGAEASEIIFTSGATESIHQAILGSLSEQPTPRHIITANTEHKATLEVCGRAEKMGHELTILPVDRLGRISVEQVQSALRPNTALVTLMHANNEIGTLHPIREIGERLADINKKNGSAEQAIFFHVDAAQTVGKVAIDVRAMHIDLLSISAHKFHGPKGIGALFVRKTSPRIPLTAYLMGGGQERGLRGGTHNVPAIVGLGKAAELAKLNLEEESTRLRQGRDKLIAALVDSLGAIDLNGHPTERLCNNISLTIHGVSSDRLAMELNDIAYSSASACSSGAVSHVLKAIGQDTSDPWRATVRFGLGRSTQDEDLHYLQQRLLEVIPKIRETTKAYVMSRNPVPGMGNFG